MDSGPVLKCRLLGSDPSLSSNQPTVGTYTPHPTTPSIVVLSARERASDPMKTLTLDQIAVLAGLEPKPGPGKVLNRPTVSRVTGLDAAASDALIFAQDAASLTAAPPEALVHC